MYLALWRLRWLWDVERFRPRRFGGPGALWSETWFGCPNPLRQLITARWGRPRNIEFHDDIGLATHQQQMLNVVTADQHQAPLTVHRSFLDHGKPGNPAAGIGERAGAESQNQPPDAGSYH
jgi:hypothetical protein